MAEEEATPAEENAEATEATSDAAAEAPAEEAPKPQSMWLPIMASSVISIVGAFALFQFVLAPKLVKGLAMVLDSNGTLHASHDEGEEGDKKHAAGGESDGHSTEGGDGHEPAEGGDPDKDDSKGAISIVGEGESIVINPANSGGSRYLLVDIYLIRASEKDKKFKAAIDANSKKLQSLTMDKLSERDIQELSNPSVRKQIENDLKNQYQHVLGSDHLIKELVVTRWIMQ
jgi:flagellar basal body-associated protein FliL